MNLQRTLSMAVVLIPLAAILPGQTAPAAGNWPMQLDDHGFHIVVYQPQVDSWKKDRLEGRAAVTATKAGSSQEAFGIVTLSARTDVDKETRMVALEDLKVTSASFPGAKPEQGDLEKAVRDSLPNWPKVIALDRLLADLVHQWSDARRPIHGPQERPSQDHRQPGPLGSDSHRR